MKKFVSVIIVFLLLSSNHLTTFAAKNGQLDLKSKGAVLLDSDTGAVLYAKNADKKMYPASLTKIATAIYAIENGNLNSMVTVSANAVRQDGTRVYLDEGEKVPLKQLIQGMLVNSGNDAAVAIAEHIDGSVEQFSVNLNAYLKSTIGVHHTHFINPNGLFDKNHFTTAMDMGLITNYAIKNPVFAEIFGTKVLKWKGKSWKTTILTHHRMLKGELAYPGVTGGKTGYTSEAKQTLSTTAANSKIRLTAVVLNSVQQRDKYDDTARLFDYGFKNFQHGTLMQGQIFKLANKEYFPATNTLITESVKGSTRVLNNEGILLIKNISNGQVLQLVPLKYKEPAPEKVFVKSESAVKKGEKDKNLTHVNAIYGVIFIALAGIIVGVRKKFIRKF
ncbi:D-alanyl-D-alanine carboxypeptidase [Bacillus sp. sid0103]|uniref:D-alanyl-D-alanine carboxypeptidase family protein n=1 Tax=Bacillus sp. sid0103 TaxID=2856337 RepID=UPI001C4535FF|nr:D-alanyl-D-alanine carboxypeptidase family protein [Bacillus sp. sid0103]MBV7506843.1 D-alanyl-D-alanine carboxypeptidase [Bacillus sp. sid0103]